MLWASLKNLQNPLLINFYIKYKNLELKNAGVEVTHKNFFDTLKIKPKNRTDFRVKCEEKQINVRYFNDGCVGVSLDETVLAQDVKDLLHLFEVSVDLVRKNCFSNSKN